jgi:hypothetical protein
MKLFPTMLLSLLLLSSLWAGEKQSLAVLPVSSDIEMDSLDQAAIHQSLIHGFKNLAEYQTMDMQSTQTLPQRTNTFCDKECALKEALQLNVSYAALPRIEVSSGGKAILRILLYKRENSSMVQVEKMILNERISPQLAIITDLPRLFTGSSQLTVQAAPDRESESGMVINGIIWTGVFTIAGVVFWLVLF